MNNRLTKAPMPEQDAAERSHNFLEVSLGYSAETAMDEAARCLACKNRPCVSGCPVGVAIPEFITLTAQGRFREAYDVISATNSLPAVCGRVCPQESQCEAKCVRGIKGEAVAIGRLERFVADWKLAQPAEPVTPPLPNGCRVAVVGAGPSGLTCAGDLARKGYAVTIFEALHTAGGVLVYGIPEFRLPKAIVAREIENLQKLGVELKPDYVVGRIISVDELFEEGYRAVFIGSGAGLPSFMGIPGENLVGVYSANEYLTRVNLMKAYRADYETPLRQSKAVAVVGGGNVAMDAARCARRMGAEVTIIYRRSLEEMPARKEEIHHAMEEGIVFRVLCNPTAVLGDDKGQVRAITCVEMVLGKPDASGRRRPVVKENSEFTVDADAVIIAIGTTPNPLIRTTTEGLEANKYGCIVVDEQMQTSRHGVYAGGDAVTGAATVILAMGAGKTAAQSIDELLRGKN